MTAPSNANTSGLAPCPFCGGAPSIRQAMGETWVVCGSCAASTQSKGRETVAFDLWNRRAAPASPLPEGGGDRRIKSELDFIKDIAANVQRDLIELEDGFSKSQRTAKTDRAVAKMRERCAVLIQCAGDALNALPAAPTGDA